MTQRVMTAFPPRLQERTERQVVTCKASYSNSNDSDKFQWTSNAPDSVNKFQRTSNAPDSVNKFQRTSNAPYSVNKFQWTSNPPDNANKFQQTSNAPDSVNKFFHFSFKTLFHFANRQVFLTQNGTFRYSE
jgi:hypothetical protein